MAIEADRAVPFAARVGDSANIEPSQWTAMAQKLRELRLERKLSVRKLGAIAGVSGSLISAIELGKARPSIGSLLALCDALGTSIPVLFGETDVTPPAPAGVSTPSATVPAEESIGRHVQRSTKRASLELASGITIERLSQSDDPDADFLLATYEPGAESCTSVHMQAHDGKEYGFVQFGELTVTIGTESAKLGPGDSIAFDSTEPHRVANAGGGPARAVWVNLHKPASYAQR